MSTSFLNFTSLVTTTQKTSIGAVEIHFSWVDHAIFAILLGVSAVIGIWFGFCGKKEDSAKEYLLGGKTMGIFPTSLSLAASCISGTTLLGVPTDVYLYGTSYWAGAFMIIPVSVIVAYVYLPVFFKLQLTSTYEYLELRFGPKLRKTVSASTVVTMILFNTIVIYIPALAFSQVTGINLHLITPICCCICIFYTTIGGLKAVVWTDAIQFIGILVGAAAVVFLGISAGGGLESIWNISEDRGRIDFFNMDPDPTLRNSFWSSIVGVFTLWVSWVGINQAIVQRFMSVPTIVHARKSMVIFVILMILVNSMSCFTGLIIFSRYYDCDPLSAGTIKRPDQLLPYYVMDVAGHIYGLPGIFIAGVFSAALSSMSTMLNSLAAIIYEDFIKPYTSKDISEKRANTIMKLTVVIIGIISTVLVVVVEKLGGVLQLVLTLAGVSAGPVLGLFTLGMLFPKANSKGAVTGGITSLVIMAIILIGSQYHIAMKHIVYEPKPLSTNSCDFQTNSTIHATPTPGNTEDLPFILFRISYYYYTFIGALLVLVVGYPVSLFTRSEEDTVHPDLISPIAQNLIPKNQRQPPPDYKTVEGALQKLKDSEDEKSYTY